MKILFISNEDDKFGAPKSMVELIVTLRKKYNIEPIVLTSCYNNINKQCEELKIENYVTKHKDFMIPLCNNKIKFIAKYGIVFMKYKLRSIKAIKLIKKYVNMDEIDIIHTNSTVIDFGANLAKKYNKRHIWHIREFGDKDQNNIAFKINAIKFMNKNTTKFIAISNAVRDGWVKRGIDEKKIKTIYNGLNLTGIEERKEKHEKNLKLIITGSISETKGQLQVLQAINILPEEIKYNIKLDIVGKGNKKYTEKLKNYVKNNNLEKNIDFVGYKSNIKDILKNYDIGIMASKSEGFGRVTVEYMAAKLCVIASDTGANTEIIDNKKNGLIYKYGNIKDLAKNIELLYNNREILNVYAENGQEKAFNNFTTEINASNIYSVYKKIMKE